MEQENALSNEHASVNAIHENKTAQSVIAIFLLIASLLLIGLTLINKNKELPSNTEKQEVVSSPKKTEPDSESTIETPSRVPTKDGNQYFYYGAPKGQNNANPKKVIISLPGHDSYAEDDYTAWLPHIKSGTYALATLNWWDGDGETVKDYYNPGQVVEMTRYFLTQQGYTLSDVVILEGFSRGSANTYAVAATDALSSESVFDGVISASGGYQEDFPLNPTVLNSTRSPSIFRNLFWVLACGMKDDNPDRDGCPAMESTKSFLLDHGANVLAILEDPDGGHGAFHAGSAKLPEQALELFDSVLVK